MAYTNPNIIASGTTFAQFQSGGASGQLEKLIAAQVATQAPTVTGTATATGGGSTGGLLAAGTYYIVVTETNGKGETTIGPESAQLTVAATNIPRYTFQALKTGNTARNLYLGAVNGPSGGPYYLYASGITTATYDLAVAVPANSYAVSPPTVNSTGLSYVDGNLNTVNEAVELVRAAKDGNLQDVYSYLHDIVQNFNRGEPISFAGAIQKLRHAHTAFALLATLCAEMGTLVDANAGTLGSTATGIGGRRAVRTWP
jgi:hypothetical protein